MNFQKIIGLLLPALIIISGVAESEQPDTSNDNQDTQMYIHEGNLYPPLMLKANFALDEFEEKLKNYQAFQSVSSNMPGRPIKLRILRGIFEKQDASRATSGLLAAVTLGLVPVVSNQVFLVRYDLLIRNESVASFEYELPMTDVSNMWNKKSKPESLVLNPEQKVFFDQSVDKFLISLSNSEISKKYFEEYFYYFD